MGTFRLRGFALTSCSADINAKSIRWNSSSILHGVGRSIIILFIKMQIYKGLLLIMVWGLQVVYMCTRTHLSMYIYVFTYTWIHFRRGIPLYYNKVEGRENEGWCCEPVPFSTNGHAVVSNWLSGNRLRPTYSVCKQPDVVSWAPSDWGTMHLRHALLT